MTHEPSNLRMHREGPNVWDQQAKANSQCRTLGTIGLLMMAAGACLVAQAYKTQLTAAVKCRASSLMRPRAGRHDEVNKASEESFPASDPPAWTPAVGKPAEA